MSGQESIRGYLFQSLIAVLKSLNTDWNSICVEPKTNLDKVDIIWTYLDDSIEVCQVKSSINNFSTNDIFKWLENLNLDYEDAKIYSIYLVGNSSHSTKIFFNSISTKSKRDFPEKYKNLFQIKNRLRIYFEPNNIDTLEDALVARVDRFFFSKEILTDYPTKKLISDGMVNQIIKISTSGKTVSKAEFENHLLEWILYNYSDQITQNKANFKLEFYSEDEFSKTISKVEIGDITKSNLYSTKREKVKNLFKQIGTYDFEVKTFEKELDFNTFPTIKSLYEYSNEPVVISNYEIGEITKALKRILNVVPEKEFFNFGELKESKTNGIFPIGSTKTTLKGSKIEKNKRNLYSDFYWEIIELIDLLDFWKKTLKLSILPIVITNTGKKHNEDIKVQLSISEKVKIVKSKDFPMPKLSQNLKDLSSEDSFLFNNIKHKQNSKVNEYYPINILPQFINLGMSVYEQKGNEEDKFRSMLNYCFDFNYYYDKPRHTIIECEFKELNTSETQALPAYIFVISRADFTIEYEITCKNEPEKITGSLDIKASS